MTTVPFVPGANPAKYPPICASKVASFFKPAKSEDPSHEWEIRNILGQKMVGSEVYYHVDWEPTWMSESELDGARELIDKFTARLQVALKRREGWTGYGEGDFSNQEWKFNGGSSTLNKAEPKKGRGRSRKR